MRDHRPQHKQRHVYLWRIIRRPARAVSGSRYGDCRGSRASAITAAAHTFQSTDQTLSFLSCLSTTVENQRSNICTKLELHGSHELLKFALQNKSDL